MIRAVLFDVGGPLNTEVEHERAVDERIRSACAMEGKAVDAVALEVANREAVRSFAPDTYRSIIWHLADHDRATASRVHNRFLQLGKGIYPFEMREGIPDLLAYLTEHGLRLGLAANQPRGAVQILDRLGIGQFFTHRGVSGDYGFRKPDVRLILAASNELGVSADECVMVGDRVDNDVVPAKLLGMRTVLIRTGRHRDQQPRCWEELPDAEVVDVHGMRVAIVELIRLAELR